MSEVLPGIPYPPRAAARPRDAAVVILTRTVDGATEVYWVRRGRHLRFSAGFYAFPGGGVDSADASIPVDGASGPEAALLAAAARELFEEAGVLRVRTASSIPAEALAAHRRDLLAKRATFASILEALGARIAAADFTPAGRWITPEFSPIRFDARFFLAAMPPDQRAEIWDGELVDGGWITPSEALDRWSRGIALLHPPNLNAMQSFLPRDAGSALVRLRNPPDVFEGIGERIEFQQGILVYPVRTPTLPPATHTACYLVGNRELLIVDPGSPDPVEQHRLHRFVARLVAEGRRVVAVVLTHHHGDHTGGALAASRAFGVPLWAHAATAEHVAGVERLLDDGEVVTLAGDPAIELRVLHTPGHARGHICLFEPASRALLCGDMVSGVSTIVIDPPEGDMGDYLDSLRRLADLGPGTLYPAHGDPIPDGRGKLEQYLQHRLWREERIVAALRDGPRSIASVVEIAYDDTPKILYPLAARSTLASLIRLEREGRVVRDGELFRLP